MNHEDEFSAQIAYIHGRIEAQIEAFANACGLPARQLASRVGELLLSAPGREVLGPEDRVPELPRKAGKRRKAVAAVEVAERPHGKPRLSPEGAAKLRRMMKRRWRTVWKHKRRMA